MPRTPVAGPLSISREASRLLLQEAVRRVMTTPGTTLQIKTSANDLDDIIDGMKGAVWRESYVLELPNGTGGSVRFGNSKEHCKVAWAVKRALRLGVKVREGQNEEDLKAWYRLYLETMRRVVALARSYRFFQELWRKMRPLGMMKLLVVERAAVQGTQMLAGSIFLAYGSIVRYAFTGCNVLALATHANDLLQWEAIHLACKEGLRYYDFGEVAEERPELARFKRKWSAVAIPLYRYHYPPADSSESQAAEDPSSSGWVREVWKRMPLGMTGVLGGRIFRRL